MSGMALTRVETDRREAVVREALERGLSPTHAVLEAGYSNTTAYNCATTIVARSVKNSPMISALDDVGVSTIKLAKKIKRGLKATKMTRVVAGGEISEYCDPDYATQHRFLETALRLRGEDPDLKTEATRETFEQRIARVRLGAQQQQIPAANPENR